MLRLLLSTLVILFFSARTYSQASVSAEAFAEIISAISATETAQLNFGKFSPQVQGGQVIITPEGMRTSNGTVILGGGTANSGVFHLTGSPDAAFSIQLPDAPAILTHQNSNKTMSVSEWVSYPKAGNGTGVLVNGEQFVHLGATLHVNSLNDNPVGLYSGSFKLTFAYN